MARKKKNTNPTTAHRGSARAAFFANGGDPAQWMMPKRVVQDKKKAQSRRACRGKVYHD